MRRVLHAVLLGLIALGLVGAANFVAPSGTGVAEAKAKSKSKSKSRSKKPKGSVKECSGKGKKKKCRRIAMFTGHNAAKSSLRTEPLAPASGDIWVKSENVQTEVKLNLYKSDGTFDEASLAALDDVFRCKRTNDVRAVRPELYEMLSRIYDHFGGKRINLVSGFRGSERSSSRHFHASAMDIRIEGVSIRELYEFAETLDAGGMGIGIYPRSQFVHVDYRAPGDASYRWTDRSGPNDGGGKKKKSKKKKTGRTQPARKPVS